MNLRSTLSTTIDLLDGHPEIDTKKFSQALVNAVEAFKDKFQAAVKLKEADKKWEKLRGELVKMPLEELGAELRSMDDRKLAELWRFLGGKPIKATKKLTARENAEIKISSKIKEIGKQLH